MSLVGIDPPRVLELADTMGDAANDSFLWGQLVGQQAQRCWLETATPAVLDELAGDLIELGRILRARAWYADEFRPQFDRLIVGLNGLTARYVPLAFKPSGVLSLFGSTDVANPTERVEIYRGQLAGDLGDLAALGLTVSGSLARSYLLEYRRDGTAKITVIDDAAIGLGAGAGRTTGAPGNINGVLPSSTLSIDAKVQLLAGLGEGSVIPAGDVELFVQHDLLVAATGGQLARFGRAVGEALETLPDCAGGGSVKVCTTAVGELGKLVKGVGEAIGQGVEAILNKSSAAARKLGSALDRSELQALAAALAYRPPRPTSKFVQAGSAGRIEAKAIAQAVKKFGLAGAAGQSVVAGLSTMGTTNALYLNLSATASGEAALGLFNERFDAQSQVQMALVEDAADGSVFADLTLSSVHNGEAQRRAVRIDLRDPKVKALFERVLRALLDGAAIEGAVREAFDGLRNVALHLSREAMSFRASTKLDLSIGKTGFTVEKIDIDRR